MLNAKGTRYKIVVYNYSITIILTSADVSCCVIFTLESQVDPFYCLLNFAVREYGKSQTIGSRRQTKGNLKTNTKKTTTYKWSTKVLTTERSPEQKSFRQMTERGDEWWWNDIAFQIFNCMSAQRNETDTKQFQNSFETVSKLFCFSKTVLKLFCFSQNTTLRLSRPVFFISLCEQFSWRPLERLVYQSDSLKHRTTREMVAWCDVRDDPSPVV